MVRQRKECETASNSILGIKHQSVGIIIQVNVMHQGNNRSRDIPNCFIAISTCILSFQKTKLCFQYARH